jgi:hypothetical protein
MTDGEIAANVLLSLVNMMAEDMLTGNNSGVEHIYSSYVRELTIEEGSY